MSDVVGHCDRCDTEILDSDTAICFNDEENQTYLCEPCVEDIKREWINENRDRNIIESD